MTIITKIPHNVWIRKLLPYMTTKDIVRLGFTSYYCYILTRDNSLWQQLLQNEFVNLERQQYYRVDHHLIRNTIEADEVKLLIQEDRVIPIYNTNINSDAPDDNDIVIDYRQEYARRAVEFYIWKKSLYSRRNSEHNQILNTIFDTCHTIRSYIRILLWIFVYPTVQPVYILQDETKEINQYAITAGNYLMTGFTFIPLLMSGFATYSDRISFPLINSLLQLIILLVSIVMFKYGSVQILVSMMSWCVIFVIGLLMQDLLLCSLLLIMLSITFAISRSLRAMLLSRGMKCNDIQREEGSSMSSFISKRCNITTVLGGTIVAIALSISCVTFTIASLFTSSSWVLLLVFAISVASGTVAFILYFTTKWSLLAGRFPRRSLLHRTAAWITLLLLLSTHVIFYVRVTMVTFFSFPKYFVIT